MTLSGIKCSYISYDKYDRLSLYRNQDKLINIYFDKIYMGSIINGIYKPY